MSGALPWAAVVVSSREAPEVLLRTLQALAQAAPQQALHTDVLVNGNPALAQALVPALAASPAWAATPLHRWRVWHIALGDKAHALNEYLHRIHEGGQPTFFVDGYVRVRPDALQQLAAALQAQPDKLAATGVPTVGRSARAVAEMLARDGGVHGNLFALSSAAVQRMREAGFRLPVGLYRTDSTIGSALSFGLNPPEHTWSPHRFIATVPAASWDLDAAAWWRPRDWMAQWRRRQRQARGDLENWAVRFNFQIERRGLDCLPAGANALVREWSHRDPQGVADRLRGHRRRQKAMAEMSRQQPSPSPLPEACLIWPATSS